LPAPAIWYTKRLIGHPPIVRKKVANFFRLCSKSLIAKGELVYKLGKVVYSRMGYVEENEMQTKKLLPLTSERLEKLMKHQTAMLAEKEQASKKK